MCQTVCLPEDQTCEHGGLTWNNETKIGLRTFLEGLKKYDDVYVVTPAQVIAWMREGSSVDPAGLQKAFAKPKRPAALHLNCARTQRTQLVPPCASCLPGSSPDHQRAAPVDPL